MAAAAAVVVVEDGKKERKKKRMTEKKDQQGAERGEGDPLDCQALHSRRVYTPWAPRPAAAVAAVQHTAKATPTQRMNGRQVSLRAHVSTYVPTYAGG